MDSKKTEYVWSLRGICNTFLTYIKCGFYKTLFFSMILYPFPVLFKLDKRKIRKKKNNVLKKELIYYIQKNHGISIKSLESPFAIVAFLEIFPKALYDYFPVNKRDVVYDVGATTGEYALKCAKEGAEVLAFELDKKAYSSMLKNIKANKFEKKIMAFNCRIDDKKNSLDKFYLSTKKAPTIMKIDIEGDEVKALKGAKRIFKKYKPKIIVETHTKKLEEKCIKILKQYGYKIKKKIDMNSKNKETRLLFLVHCG